MESRNRFSHLFAICSANRSNKVLAFTLLCASTVADATPIDIQTISLTTDRIGWGGSVNNSGQVVFSQGSFPSNKIMLNNPAPLQGGLFQYTTTNNFVYTPAINNSGDIAYEDNGAIWINKQSVVHVGDPVPATPANPAGQTFTMINGLYNHDFSDAGEVTFWAQTNLGNAGLWKVNAAGVVTQVITEGELAPGGGGASFSGISSPAMNSNGDLIFSAILNDGSATKGIWRQKVGGMLERVTIDTVTVISPITGLPTQVPFDFISQISNLAVDGNGNPIFSATIQYQGLGWPSSPLTGVWRINGADAEFIPGASGWNLDANSAGQIAFMSGDLYTTHDLGVWASDLFGEINLIAMQGQLLEVMEGDLRTIAAVNFAPQGLSDAGHIAFNAFFDDGSSGVFLATFNYQQQTAVPSPGTAVLLLSGLMGIPFMGRGRRLNS